MNSSGGIYSLPGRDRGGNDYVVLLSPEQPNPPTTGRTPKLGSALIWKGSHDRPMTCSYSFPHNSSRKTPTDWLQVLGREAREGGGGGGRLPSPYHSAKWFTSPSSRVSVRNVSMRPTTSDTWLDDGLETILCDEEDRARCDLLCLSSTREASSFDGVLAEKDGDGPTISEGDVTSRIERGVGSTSECKGPRMQAPASDNLPSTPVTPFRSRETLEQKQQDKTPTFTATGYDFIGEEQDLRNALKAHDIEGTFEILKELGIRKITDLALLAPEDFTEPSLGLNVLQRRLLKTAVAKEVAASKKLRADAEQASQTWSQMTDDRGWYAPAFSSEPPGLKVTVLEPAELAGTVIDCMFGSSRDDLCEAVTRTQHGADSRHDQFEMRIKIGRTDKTEFDANGGVLGFGVVGVSKKHAEIIISCGDAMPATIRVRDEGSTNGSFLLRPAGSTWASQSSDAELGGSKSSSRPTTPGGTLMQLKLEEGCWSNASGCPYLRLGPRLVLGLSLPGPDSAGTGRESCFSLDDVALATERLYTEPDLRRLGWQYAELGHVHAAKQRNERVKGLLDCFAAGGRSAVTRGVNSAVMRGVKVSPAGQTSAGQCSEEKGSAALTLCRELPSGQVEKGGGHVFLSYQWESQHVVKAVARELKARGYSVWIDLEQMRGEMNQRMAEAVEGAAVVCPFVTRLYKKSVNCMKELNYADQLGKTFLPIILDDCDRSELLKGQVGIITSNLIYIDLSRAASRFPKDVSAPLPPDAATLFATKMGEIERALGQQGKPYRALPFGPFLSQADASPQWKAAKAAAASFTKVTPFISECTSPRKTLSAADGLETKSLQSSSLSIIDYSDLEDTNESVLVPVVVNDVVSFSGSGGLCASSVACHSAGINGARATGALPAIV